MPTRPERRAPMQHCRFALLPVVALYAASASAQVSPATPTGEVPWYVGIQQTFGHEENVHPTPISTSDNFSTTALRGGVNALFGRQRLFGDGSISYTKYDKNDDLSHNGWD